MKAKIMLLLALFIAIMSFSVLSYTWTPPETGSVYYNPILVVNCDESSGNCKDSVVTDSNKSTGFNQATSLVVGFDRSGSGNARQIKDSDTNTGLKNFSKNVLRTNYGTMCFSFIINITSVTYNNDNRLFSSSAVSANREMRIYDRDNVSYAIYQADSAGGTVLDEATSCTNMTRGSWMDMCFNWSLGAIDMYVNNVYCNINDNTQGSANGLHGIYDENGEGWGFGDQQGSTYAMDVVIDSIVAWDIKSTATNNLISNYHTGSWPLAAQPINITTYSPENNYQTTKNKINFNLTGDFSNNIRAELYINGTLNQTRHFLGGKNVFVSFNASFITAKAYTYLINISDNISSTTSKTSLRTFYVDTVIPSLKTNFINGSIYIYKNLTGQFNFSDEFLLHSYNISIDGQQKYNKTNLNTKTVSFGLSYSVSNLTAGLHSLTVRFADGHTAEELKGDFVFNNGLFNDYSEYSFYDGGYVKTKLEDQSIFDDWKSEEKIDRYTQILKPATPSSTIILIEESDKPIYIVEKQDRYKGSWVIIGNHWKDYVLENEPDSKVKIERIDSNKVKVTISDIKNNQEELKFNSLGDLNIVTKEYSFTVADIEMNTITAQTQYKNVLFTLKINNTGTIGNTAATFHYINTSSIFTPTKTSYSNYDLFSITIQMPVVKSGKVFVNNTFMWIYYANKTGSIGETGALNSSHWLYAIGIDNGTNYRMETMTINVYDEETNLLMNKPSVSGFFKIWTSNINNYSVFNLTWKGANNTPYLSKQYGIYMTPNSSIYYTYGQIEYLATGYNKKLYYFDNTTLTNSTKLLNLYLNNLSSQVTLTVTDTNDNPVKDVIIKVLSYDLTTNSYKTTEVLKTDTDGVSLAQIVLNTKWYFFILEYNGKIVLQTEPTKIITTSRTFRINLQSDYFERFGIIRSMSHSLTYTNSTRNFAFTWDDTQSEITQACLKLELWTTRTKTLLNSSCSSSPTGTILLHLSGNLSQATYFATSYALFNDGQQFTLDTLEISFDYNYEQFGLSGMFLSFILIVTLFCIGIWHPAPALILLLVGLLVSVVLEMFYIQWGVLIAIIIIVIMALMKMRG